MAEPTRGTVTISAPTLREQFDNATDSPGSRYAMRGVFLVVAAALALTHTLPGTGIDWWWAFLIGAAAYALFLAVVVYVRALRNPPPQLDFDRAELRVGAEIIPFRSLDSAVVVTELIGPTVDLALDIAATEGKRIRLILRSTRKRELTTSEREAVAAMIALSGIRVPDATPDPYDPTGKFSWMDYPNHRSKEAAIELVLQTPESGSLERKGTHPGDVDPSAPE